MMMMMMTMTGCDVDVSNDDSMPGMYVVKTVLSGQSRPSLVSS